MKFEVTRTSTGLRNPEPDPGVEGVECEKFMFNGFWQSAWTIELFSLEELMKIVRDVASSDDNSFGIIITEPSEGVEQTLHTEATIEIYDSYRE